MPPPGSDPQQEATDKRASQELSLTRPLSSGTTGTAWTTGTSGSAEAASAVLPLLLILLELVIVKDALYEVFLSLHPFLHLFHIAEARATALVLLHLLSHLLALCQEIIVQFLVLCVCSVAGFLDTVNLPLSHILRVHLRSLTGTLGKSTRCQNKGDKPQHNSSHIYTIEKVVTSY